MEPLHNVFSKNPVSDVKMGNFDHVTKVHRADISLIADFLDNTFETFAAFPQQQKVNMFFLISLGNDKLFVTIH